MTDQSNANEESWETYLELLREISVESSLWNSFELFVYKAYEIAQEKLAEAAGLEKTQKLKAMILSNMPYLLEIENYFEGKGIEDWPLIIVPTEKIEELIDKLEGLCEQWDQFSKFRNQTHWATRAERMQWEADYKVHEDSIFNEYLFLDEIFQGVKNEEEVDIPPNSPIESPEEETARHDDFGANVESTNEVVPASELDFRSENDNLLVEADEISPVTEGEKDGKHLDFSIEPDESAVELLSQESGRSESVVLHESITPEESDLSTENDEPDTNKFEGSLWQEEEVQEDLIETVTESSNGDTRLDEGELEAGLEEELYEEDLSDESDAFQLEDENPQEEISTDQLQENIIEGLTENIPISYWLALSIEKKGETPISPPWLIAATQGALWHLDQYPSRAPVLLESTREMVKPSTRIVDDNSAAIWLYLGVGLYFSLIDPGNGWDTWLNTTPTSAKLGINTLIESFRDANMKGLQLDPVKIQVVMSEGQTEKIIKALTEEMQKWLEQAQARKARILRASKVWQHMVRTPNGDLYKFIEPALLDQRDKIGAIQEAMLNWQDRTWIDKHVRKIDGEINGKKARPIVGEALNQLVEWINDLCDLVSHWIDAVVQTNIAAENTNWSLEQLKNFCYKTSDEIDIALIELKESIQQEEDPLVRATLKVFEELIRKYKSITSPEKIVQQDSNKKSLGIRDKDIRLEEKLAKVLIRYPTLQLSNQGFPEEGTFSQFANILSATSIPSAEQAIEGWIERHDYRFVMKLLDELDDRENLELKCREALRTDLNRLERSYIEKTVIAIEQALLNGLIAEGDHTAFRSTVESIKKQIKHPNLLESGGVSVRIFYNRLSGIQNQLDEKYQERLLSFKNHWGSLDEQLGRIVNDNYRLADTIRGAVRRGLEEKNLRLVGEYLAQLDGALAGDIQLGTSMFETHSDGVRQIVSKFQRTLPDLVNLLESGRSGVSLRKIGDLILQDRPLPGYSMQSLPKPHRERVRDAFDAWVSLKRDGLTNSPQWSLPYIEKLMSYLGFILKSPNPVSIHPSPNSLRNFQHWRVAATAGDFSPVAQFGSLREGYYDVIGVWDRPGIEVISSQVSALMKQTGNRPTILFYFHYMTPGRRNILFNTARREHLPMIVIDEAVLLFLADNQGSRLINMFPATLPYASVNPYFPSVAGLIPPEVFKGRRDMVRRLTDPYGPAIVYGGRQLGKSALLRQAQRTFHHPDNRQFVVYEDIKLIGDPAFAKDYQVDFRDHLAKQLVSQKLIEHQSAVRDLDRLLLLLQQLIIEKDWRVLLLLDEADQFLDADANKNFYVVQRLKTMMDQTGRRFKIVFAGLHNVQRFQRIPNQPLAHLAAIEIGPLDPDSAHELLVQPLHALGYQFGLNPRTEETPLVLHILSYTNYHPGLIQLFGSSLVDHMQAKNVSNRLPIPIRREDIEAVYRKKEVREMINDRFILTLTLDPRYEAITLALILEQWDDQNGFDRLYTAKQLRDIAAEWWPTAFREDSAKQDQFKGFLQEMRGLGVLSASEDGNYYRLRSPNLVSLMGTRDYLIERMDIISKSNPPGEHALESHHARLEEGVISPLTFAQERLLNTPRSSVALIFGSSASGIRGLDHALRRLIPENNGVYKKIEVIASSSEALRKQLSYFVDDNSDAEFLLAHRELSGSTNEMLEQIREAIQFCTKMRKKILRVIFSFEPHTAWEWFQQSKDVRESLEDQVDTIISLKRWDSLGIRQRLEMEQWNSELIPSEGLLKKILDATGGWPFLLEEFITQCSGSDPAKVLNEFRDKVFKPKSSIGNSFKSALGVYDKGPLDVLKTLQNKDIQEMLKEGDPYEDVLTLELEDESEESILKAVEYLKRISVVTGKPCLSTDAVISRLYA